MTKRDQEPTPLPQVRQDARECGKAIKQAMAKARKGGKR